MKTITIFDVIKENFIGENVEFTYDKENISGKVVDIIYTPITDKCHNTCAFYFKLEDDCNEYPINILDKINLNIVPKTIIKYKKFKTISSVAPSQYEITTVDDLKIMMYYRYGRLQVYYTSKKDDCQDENITIFDKTIGESWASNLSFYDMKDLLTQYKIIFTKND